MQQATVNLFADMGAQPLTLQSGSGRRGQRRPTPSRRRRRSPRPPTATPCRANATVTITGTATDAGGGRSAASRSRSTAARPGIAPTAATAGPTLWQTGAPRTVTIRSRAVDDSGNIEAASRRHHRHRRRPSPPTCPCSIWAADQTSRQSPPSRIRARRARHAGSAPTSRATSPASASTRAPEHRHAHRQPVDATAARCSRRSTFTGETAVRLAGGRRSPTPVADHREHDLRRLVSHRPPATTSATTATSPTAASTTARCTRRATATVGGNGVYRYGASALPDQTLRQRTTGSTSCSRRRSRRTPPRRRFAARRPPTGAIGVAATRRSRRPSTKRSTARRSARRRSSCATRRMRWCQSTVTYDRAATRTVTLQPSAALRLLRRPTRRRSRAARPASRTPPAIALARTSSGRSRPRPAAAAADRGSGRTDPRRLDAARTRSASYYAEILRAEGLNAFDVTDIAAVTPRRSRATTSSSSARCR